ncbi:asparagine synthase-related protein [Marinilabilia sp.]
MDNELNVISFNTQYSFVKMDSSLFFNPAHNHGGKWTEHQGVWVKGYAFAPNDELLEGESLALYIKKAIPAKNISHALNKLNGRFAAAGSNHDPQFIISDRTRSYPLFYTIDEEKPRCSDSPNTLTNNNTKIKPEAVNQFSMTGFVWGEDTFFTNIKQCEPGNIIIFKNNDIQKIQYFTYATVYKATISEEEAIHELISSINRAFTRTLKIIGDNPVYIPLTSGYDSRLLAVLLKKQHPNNITAFTSGIKDSYEFENAQKTANNLKIPWYPIYHDEETLNETIFTGSLLDEFLDFTCGAASMTFFQDVPSMVKLKMPGNSVIVGGHSADFLAGSHLWPYQNWMPKKLLIHHALRRMLPYFSSFKQSKSIEFLVKESFNNLEQYLPYSIIEDIDFRGRQSRYIINSTRTYEFFGNKTVLPFLDNEIVDFFKTLPFSLKLKKKIYDKTLKKYFFEPYDLNFEKEFQATTFDLMRQLIKYSIPRTLAEIYTSQKTPQDNCNYMTIARILNQKEPLPQKHPNKYIFNWYIDYLKCRMR